MTTPLMEKALAMIDTLSIERQNAIAALVLDELASEDRWDKRFAESQDALGSLADAALAEDLRGETHPLDDLLR